jgi:peptidoglycan hydrolase CwlO-like protein
VGRRDNQAYISLFSFQDVMASVIGILFFIVLMMCLDIVDQTTAAAKESQDSIIKEDIENFREKIRKCDVEILEINQQIGHVSEKMQISSIGDPEVLEEIKKLNGRLKIMYVQINETQDKMIMIIARN